MSKFPAKPWQDKIHLDEEFEDAGQSETRIVQGPVFVGVLFSLIFKKSQYFDRDVTFTSGLAVTRKWNVAGVYLHLLYNMRSKQVNLRIIASQL